MGIYLSNKKVIKYFRRGVRVGCGGFIFIVYTRKERDMVRGCGGLALILVK